MGPGTSRMTVERSRRNLNPSMREVFFTNPAWRSPRTQQCMTDLVGGDWKGQVWGKGVVVSTVHGLGCVAAVRLGGCKSRASCLHGRERGLGS